MNQLVARMVCASVFVTACLASSTPARADLIDRVLALVEGQVIMLSDVRGFLQLGLVDAAGAGDPQSDTLTHLIERRLILAEVDRYAVEEPAPETIERRLLQVRARFSTEEQFGDALTQTGLNRADFRQIVRDDIRIETYLDQRFTSAVQPTDEELVTYYRRREADFIQGGRILPFAEVRETVGSRVAAERRQDLIAEWVASLSARSNVIRIDQPSR